MCFSCMLNNSPRSVRVPHRCQPPRPQLHACHPVFHGVHPVGTVSWPMTSSCLHGEPKPGTNYPFLLRIHPLVFAKVRPALLASTALTHRARPSAWAPRGRERRAWAHRSSGPGRRGQVATLLAGVSRRDLVLRYTLSLESDPGARALGPRGRVPPVCARRSPLVGGIGSLLSQ